MIIIKSSSLLHFLAHSGELLMNEEIEEYGNCHQKIIQR